MTHGITEPLIKSCHSDVRRSHRFSIAEIWSWLTFGWLNTLFNKGRSNKLQLEDVPPAGQSEDAAEAASRLEDSLRRQQRLSLRYAIIRVVWLPLLLNAVFAGLYTMASYVGPIFIKSFVNFLLTEDKSSSERQHGMMLIIIFFAAKTVESLSQRHCIFGERKIGINVKAALIHVIYNRTLSMKHVSNGEITNFINVDVERIGDFSSEFQQIWLIPVQMTLAFLLLNKNLGVIPSVAALSTTLLATMGNIPLVKLQKRLHAKIMEAKDSRTKATSEALKSMRMLKLHSWESSFLGNLLQIRETERGSQKKYLYMQSVVAFLFWATPSAISVVTFAVCIISGTPLTSSTILSTLAIFRILQEALYILPELIQAISRTGVSIDRVQSFIIREEQTSTILTPAENSPDVSIKIEESEFAWQDEDGNHKPAIKFTETLLISKGTKVAVCGSVGSGKTSLLSSILGEVTRTSGPRIETYGSIAFVPQSAWIQTGTVRENILFGKDMNTTLYRDVLEACALNHDIEMWADGDLCVVGERGVNLSGGQKQRIQMARALYSESDVYLLDDPFSAVDAHTGAHMYQMCLMDKLIGKTAVYVTHQMEFIRDSNLILVVNDGRVVESGRYEDLILNPDGQLAKQMEAHNMYINKVRLPHCKNNKQIINENTEGESSGTASEPEETHQEEETQSASRRMNWHVYSTFATSAYKGALIAPIVLCHILFQLLQMCSNYWISWATGQGDFITKKQLLTVFVWLSGGSSLFILGRAVLLSTIAIEASQRLFLGMMSSVFRAPLSFFDSTPSSWILSQSSTDQNRVDIDIPYRLGGLVFAGIQLLIIVGLICYVAWPVVLLFFLVFAISIWYQLYYDNTARELASMVPNNQAPILQHFSESITGATLIRSFNQEHRFSKTNQNLIDNYSRVSFYSSATMEWLLVRMDFFSNLLFLFLLTILVNLPRSAINPSLAGLAATYALSLNVIQSWFIWNLCNVRNKMVSVERILQFTGIPSEAPLVVEESTPHRDWPHLGGVEIQDLYIQYNTSLPTVLRGITCTFPGKKKVGILGRTGSGKSMLIQALFRVVEPTQGCILIDGLNISTLGLQELRSRLSIIPQDPILFQGTLRRNIDPLQEHPDHEIWEVIRKSHLSQIVRQDERLLDAPVAEDGVNWSVGQRQLICLARVLLQKRSILVLDEATASLDTETESQIIKTIEKESNGCTVIAVAHRTSTVDNYDYILVLGEGRVVEFNKRGELLDNPKSAFKSMMMESSR